MNPRPTKKCPGAVQNHKKCLPSRTLLEMPSEDLLSARVRIFSGRFAQGDRYRLPNRCVTSGHCGDQSGLFPPSGLICGFRGNSTGRRAPVYLAPPPPRRDGVAMETLSWCRGMHA